MGETMIRRGCEMVEDGIVRNAKVVPEQIDEDVCSRHDGLLLSVLIREVYPTRCCYR